MEQEATGPCFFLKLPLEIRHKIYGFSSQRRQPKLILKEYLEKTDPNVGPPHAMPPPLPPPPPPPVAQVNVAEDEDEEQEGEGADENEELETQEEDENVDMEDAEEEEEGEGTADVTGAVTATAVQAPVAAPTNNDDEAEDEEEGEDGEDQEDNEDEDDEDAEGEEAEDDGTAVASAPILARREHSYGRQTKYRHILKTIKLRGCPPPIGLLQANKQLNQEATEYHRNTSVLEIDITKNFAHQSFFEETLDKFISNPFSPVEQVRKVSITITWDSEWLRTKSTPPDAELEDIWSFEYYFNDRVQKTIDLFRGAPELRHIVINWHDTERTNTSENLMNDTYMKFLQLTDKQWDDNSTNPPTQKNLDITLHEQISDAGAAHAANSLLALRRTEFDQLLASRMAFR